MKPTSARVTGKNVERELEHACGSEKEGSVLESAAPGQERADKIRETGA